MNTHSDFEEFLKLLTDHQVEFVVVGGYAVAFHGYVRATQDIDVFFRNTEENAHRILSALREFGIQVDDAFVEDLREPGSIVRLGFPPVKIEMINTISGVTFEQVWGNRSHGSYGQVSVSFISLADLLVNKKASGRPKDLADYDELGGNRPTEHPSPPDR